MTLRTPVVLSTLLAALACPAVLADPSPRRDLLAQCPALAEHLPEALASAQRAVGLDADVQVLLRLDAGGLARIESLSGPRAYHARVRSALSGLDCRSAVPQRQLLTIRFQDPRALPPGSRVAAATTPQ